MSAEVIFRVTDDMWMSANHRHHWAKKARATRSLREAAFYNARLAGIEDAQMATTHVTAFIGYPRSGKVDPANANPTVKALIDGLVDAGVWADDDSTHVIGPDFRVDKPTREKGVHSVRLVLEAVAA